MKYTDLDILHENLENQCFISLIQWLSKVVLVMTHSVTTIGVHDLNRACFPLKLQKKYASHMIWQPLKLSGGGPWG